MEPKRHPSHVRHVVIMSVIAAVLSFVLAFLFLRVDFIPGAASTERNSIDSFVKLMFGIAGVFFAVVVTVFVYALIFFRRRKGDDSDAEPIRGSTPLELAWTLIPLAVVTVLGTYGAIVLDRMVAPPKVTSPDQSELQVDVIAFRFGWMFEYPAAGVRSFELEVPIDRPILFRIQSMDVVHSFWVQEFGPKQDAVPGMTTELRITPTRTGNFQVQCSQLCGSGHTLMVAPVHVVAAGDFQSWLLQQQKIPPKTTPPATTTPTTTPTPTTAPAPGGSVTINLTAKNVAFDVSTITVSRGAQVTIVFNNQDASVPHNFAVYTDSSASKSVFVGQIVTGPKTVTYTFTAPTTPGSYFFRCDVHPTIMTGTFVVQ